MQSDAQKNTNIRLMEMTDNPKLENEIQSGDKNIGEDSRFNEGGIGKPRGSTRKLKGNPHKQDEPSRSNIRTQRSRKSRLNKQGI